MSASRLRTWSSRSVLGLISLLVMLGNCSPNGPLSVGHWAPMDTSQPFPCQDRPSGCRSAQQCWTQQCWTRCCCFSNSQKLAGARVRSVQLPQNVKAVAQLDICQTSSCCTSTHRVQQASRAEKSDVARATRQGGAVYVIATLAQLCEGNYWIWNAVAVFRAER